MPDDKNKGLYGKYEVKKLSNPEKQIDCIVLEFDDPIAHEGIWAWAQEMREKGYYKVYSDTIDKLNAAKVKNRRGTYKKYAKFDRK